MKTIHLTDDQYNALKSITIEPTKKGSWKPKLGHGYWGVTDFGLEHPLTFHDDSYDRDLLDFGNVFSSEENALKASKAMRIHNKILQYIIENDSDWEADWKNHKQYKWFPLFDHFTKQWECDFTGYYQRMPALYCSKKCCKELVELLNNGWLEENS